MQRRSTAVSGWVDFPVHDPALTNTKEGGMLVKLVVCDNREFEQQFGMCTGAQVFDILAESFVGDDCRAKPPTSMSYDPKKDILEQHRAEQQALADWEGYHFPNLHDETSEGIERYTSRPYLASMVLGTSGWSGWDEAAGEYWICKFENLTEDGKALYRQLEKLYSGCDLHLLTFVDT